MESTSLLDEDFSYPDLSFFRKLNSSVNAYFDSDSSYKTVELEIDKDIVKYFERIPISSKQKLYASPSNNYMTLSIEVTNINEIVPTIQQYLPKIKVIYPPELNEIIKNNIAEYNIY
jgi:predicted DNA-binding transcriptional regulator YafY